MLYFDIVLYTLLWLLRQLWRFIGQGVLLLKKCHRPPLAFSRVQQHPLTWQFISSWWDHHLEQNPFGGNIWPNWERPAHKELAYINNWTSIKVKFWWQCFVFRIASLFIDLEKGNDLNLSPHIVLYLVRKGGGFFSVCGSLLTMKILPSVFRFVIWIKTWRWKLPVTFTIVSFALEYMASLFVCLHC